jgi:hypothetical protein
MYCTAELTRTTRYDHQPLLLVLILCVMMLKDQAAAVIAIDLID